MDDRLAISGTQRTPSVVLPGTGPQSGKKPLTYWQSVAQIGVQVAACLDGELIVNAPERPEASLQRTSTAAPLRLAQATQPAPAAVAEQRPIEDQQAVFVEPGDGGLQRVEEADAVVVLSVPSVVTEDEGAYLGDGDDNG